jgi:steroid delta-isomerase-like uncharacterized protein
MQTTPASRGKEEPMSVESTRQTMTRYFDSEHSDLSMMADDVVFTHMATGDEHRGPDGVRKLLNYMYHVAFDATADVRNTIIADGKAVLEADFTGTHIGEFAGIAPTGRKVRVPLCVVYDLENDKIKRGRVYMEMPVMMQQLGVTPARG